MDLHRFSSAIRYLLRSKGKAMLHSPLLYELAEQVLDKDMFFHDFDVLDELRADLVHDETVLRVEDHGAGSRTGQGNRRKVSQIARSAVKGVKYAELMYRLANWQRSERILELGTSLGLTSLYLAKARPHAVCHTVEGSEEIAAFARNLLDQQGASQVEVHHARFEDILPELAPKERWDLVFIDGNHRYEATMENTRTILQHADPRAIFVIDDIHWSRDMTRAWDELRRMEEFTLSVDLFEMGLLFRQYPMEKQHICLRY